MANIFNTSKAGTKKNIFISYRVNDTAGETGRLVDTLKSYFNEDQIFMDIDKIEPGVDFTEVIAKSLEQCDVMLAIIGKNWKGTAEGSAKTRINQPNDWVRLELATALQRNIKVILVLVDGGTLPEEDELPEDLHPLIKRQAYEISNKRWKYDTDQLAQYLIKCGINPKFIPPPVKQSSGKMNTGIKILIGGLALLGFLAVIGLLLPQEKKGRSLTNPQPVYQNKDSGNSFNNNPNNNNSDNNNLNNENNKSAEPVTIPDANIAGNWNESNGLYTMIIYQNGSSVTAQSYSAAGQQTADGTGTVKSNTMVLNMNVYGTGLINIKATLSADGSNLTGSYHIEKNGYSYNEPFNLIRQY